jgi:hypothetical protein
MEFTHFRYSVSRLQCGRQGVAGLQQERKTRQEIVITLTVTVAQAEAKGVQEKVLKVRREPGHYTSCTLGPKTIIRGKVKPMIRRTVLNNILLTK